MDRPSTSDTSNLLANDTLGANADDVLVRDETFFFKPLRTIPLAVIQVILSVALFAESMVYLCFNDICRNETTLSISKTTEFNNGLGLLHESQKDRGTIVTYSIALVWILTWALHCTLKYVHRRHRSVGYLRVYARTKRIASIPLIVYSIGSFFLLVVLPLRDVVFKGVTILGESWFFLSLQIITGLELLVTFVSLLVYIVKVAKFNSSRCSPDVFEDTTISSMPLIFNARSAIEIGPGIQEPNKEIALLELVCEKQGDLIIHLRHRCDVLCERLNRFAATNA